MTDEPIIIDYSEDSTSWTHYATCRAVIDYNDDEQREPIRCGDDAPNWRVTERDDIGDHSAPLCDVHAMDLTFEGPCKSCGGLWSMDKNSLFRSHGENCEYLIVHPSTPSK